MSDNFNKSFGDNIFTMSHIPPPQKVLCAVYLYAVSQTKMVHEPHKVNWILWSEFKSQWDLQV